MTTDDIMRLVDRYAAAEVAAEAAYEHSPTHHQMAESRSKAARAAVVAALESRGSRVTA